MVEMMLFESRAWAPRCVKTSSFAVLEQSPETPVKKLSLAFQRVGGLWRKTEVLWTMPCGQSISVELLGDYSHVCESKQARSSHVSQKDAESWAYK